MAPIAMPILPTILLRPKTPKEIDNAKIRKNIHSEFHHFASFAVKHIKNQINPVKDKMMLARPNVLFFCERDKLFII